MSSWAHASSQGTTGTDEDQEVLPRPPVSQGNVESRGQAGEIGQWVSAACMGSCPCGAVTAPGIFQCQPVTALMRERAARVKQPPSPEASHCWTTQPSHGDRQERALRPPCSFAQGPALIFSEKSLQFS